MADAFNPYSEWLGLPADQTEPNHYQLLCLPPFEGDAARIATAADRAMSRVRGFRPGANARAWSKLLDELLLAKGKLLDLDRKSEYDAELRESGVSEKTEPSAATPANTTTAAPVPFDPRFPPGMGPNSGKAPTKENTAPAPEPERSRIPAPAPVTPAPVAPAPAAVAPVAPSSAPTAWPSSMMHPVAPAPAVLPQQPAPTQPAPVPSQPQPAPLAQPMYGAPQPQPGYAPQGYAQPGYPQSSYPQPGYPQQPVPQYPGAPQYGMQPAYPQPLAPQPMAPQYGAPAYPQPGYAPQQPAYQQPAPVAYGQPYGMPTPPTPPAPEPPVSNPFGSLNNKLGLGGTMFGPSAHAAPGTTGSNMPGPHEALAGVPLDPMAPVAMPTSLPGESGKGRVVGFAGGQPAIPKGKAVAATPAASSAPAAATALEPVNTSSAPAVPAPTVSAYSPDAAVAAAQNESSKSDKMLFYGSAAAILLLIGAIVFAIMHGNSVNREVAENPTIPPEPTSPVDPKPAKGPSKVIMPAVKPSDPKPIAPPPADPVKPMIDPPAMTDPPPPPMRKPPETTPPPEVKPKPPEPEEMKPEPKPPTPPPPEPKPEPKPEPTPPPEVKLTPAELTALSMHLKSAKEALRERNFAETETHIAAAQKLAKSEDQMAKTQRLKMVADYVKQFDRSLKTLMADENFDAGAELVIGKGTRVVVVERNPTAIVIRIAGQNKSYALASLPDGLAMALIDKRLDANDSTTKIIKASYLAAAKVATEDNQEKAKSLWEEAKAVDPAGVGDLPLFLTDSYDFTE